MCISLQLKTAPNKCIGSIFFQNKIKYLGPIFSWLQAEQHRKDTGKSGSNELTGVLFGLFMALKYLSFKVQQYSVEAFH